MKRGSSLKYAAAIVVAALSILGVTMAIRARQGLSPLGNRLTIPTLPADGKAHYLIYHNPKTNKVFLRIVIQNPDASFGYLLLSNDGNDQYYKSVEVVAQGKTGTGKTAVSTLKDIRYLPRWEGQDPWREYVVLRKHLRVSPPATNAPGDDMLHSLDWISFDMELKYPASASRREQRRFLNDVAFFHSVHKLEVGNTVDRIRFPVEDPIFMQSLDAFAPAEVKK